MRRTAFALIAALSMVTMADAASLKPPIMTEPYQSDVIQVQNFNSSSGQSNRNDRRDRRRTDFVCVITPPDSARRSRPYVCPVQQGRVGGRCRCSGVVGSGTVDTAW